MTPNQGRASRRLDELSRRLNAERAPYYVRRPIPPGLQQSFPAEGWYWVPHGHHVAVFLAASFEDAAVVLHRMIEELVNA